MVHVGQSFGVLMNFIQPAVAEVTQKPRIKSIQPSFSVSQVVKQNVLGTVVGQSATDPAGRVTVAFGRREDGRSNNLRLGCCGWEPKNQYGTMG